MCLFLPAAGATDKPSQYTKQQEMKDCLQQLEKHWSEYVPDSPEENEENPGAEEEGSPNNGSNLVDGVDGLGALLMVACATSDDDARAAAEILLQL